MDALIPVAAALLHGRPIHPSISTRFLQRRNGHFSPAHHSILSPSQSSLTLSDPPALLSSYLPLKQSSQAPRSPTTRDTREGKTADSDSSLARASKSTMADAHRKRPQPDDPQPSTTSRPNMTTSLSHRSRPCPGQQSDRNEFSHPSADAVAAGNTSDDDDDFTSSSGSDSSDEESDDDGEEGQSGDEHDQVKSDDGRDQALPRIPARQKPRIQHVERDGNLLARISAFLPQMKNANDELQREIEAGRAKEIRLDEVDDQNEGQYIEMVR